MQKNILFSDSKHPSKSKISFLFYPPALSCITAFFLLLQSSPSAAQFVGNSNTNTPICTATTSQYAPQIISDGARGYIITWYDQRSGNDDVYAQRINSTGVPQWTANGVAICTAVRDQYLVQIVSDGAGGAIITWEDQRNGSSNSDIYAQRVNASGVVQWTADGVVITAATNNQGTPRLTSDGASGAIITWQDQRSGSGFDVYAQRVNAAGVVQWTADGVAIGTATNSQYLPQIISDGAGGAVITWQDNRASNWDIYAQKINTSGVVQWTANGVAISAAAIDQTAPQITSDNAGGGIITWQDFRSLSTYDIYAQRIDASGAVQWTADGVAISTVAGYQQNPRLTTDGASGAIITWEDQRNGSSNADIYAQRINATGTVQWTADGVVISSAANNQTFPQLITDGAGGAIITWPDQRVSTVNTDIYAQKINGSGIVQWTANGVAICTAAQSQSNPQLASNSSGGAVLTWEDPRNGATNYDIYSQNVQASGILPIKWLSFSGTVSLQGQASLQWRVEENRIASYQVERNCGAGFSTVATINSKGDGTNSYNFVDVMQVLSNGCQYRIKQTDIDGRFSYSAILLLKAKQATNILTLQPNPVKDITSLQYEGSIKGMITYRVLDAGGRTVLQKNVDVDAGINVIPLQVERLSAGIYTVLLHSSEGQSTLRFIKE